MEYLLAIDEGNPTVGELAGRFGVNRVTANDRVRLLEAAGLVERVKGRCRTTGRGEKIAHEERVKGRQSRAAGRRDARKLIAEIDEQDRVWGILKRERE